MLVKVVAEGLLPRDAGSEITLVAQSVAEAAEAAGLIRRSGLVILVNGRLAEWNSALRDGDVIEFMPALGGG